MLVKIHFYQNIRENVPLLASPGQTVMELGEHSFDGGLEILSPLPHGGRDQDHRGKT